MFFEKKLRELYITYHRMMLVIFCFTSNNKCNCILCVALEEKVRLGEKAADGLVKENTRLEVELESMTKKSHDASGQLVIISQELLKKER